MRSWWVVICKGVLRGKKCEGKYHLVWSWSRLCEVWWVGKEVGCLSHLSFFSFFLFSFLGFEDPT